MGPARFPSVELDPVELAGLAAVEQIELAGLVAELAEAVAAADQAVSVNLVVPAVPGKLVVPAELVVVVAAELVGQFGCAELDNPAVGMLPGSTGMGFAGR